LHGRLTLASQLAYCSLPVLYCFETRFVQWLPLFGAGWDIRGRAKNSGGSIKSSK
jgi:hypothetical protein